MSYRSRILGIGMSVPSSVVTNHDLAARMETSHEWIVERTGIEQRRWVSEGETGASLATNASREAIARCRPQPTDIDLIIYATLSPDFNFPGTGVFVQRELGLRDIPCLDIRQQCTGFIYGSSIADAYIRTGMFKNIAAHRFGDPFDRHRRDDRGPRRHGAVRRRRGRGGDRPRDAMTST